MALLDDVKTIVQGKLTTTIESATLDIAIDEVAFAIREYCNITEIPAGLKYTWVNMTVDLATYESEKKKAEADVLANIDASDVSSIKIGDMQINLQGGSSSNERNKALKSHKPNLDQIVLNYTAQLNRHRRMVW